jgi:hypothetical protein
MALSLLIWRSTIEAPIGDEVARVGESDPTRSETAASADEWSLAMTTDSRTDSDDTLPPDYVAISELLIGD